MKGKACTLIPKVPPSRNLSSVAPVPIIYDQTVETFLSIVIGPGGVSPQGAFAEAQARVSSCFVYGMVVCRLGLNQLFGLIDCFFMLIFCSFDLYRFYEIETGI